MNTVLSQLNQMLDLCEKTLHPRSEISPKSTVMRMEIRLVKAIQDAENAAAAMCKACKELGIPVRDVVSIDFGPVVDNE